MHLLRNNVNYKNTINKAWDDESLLYQVDYELRIRFVRLYNVIVDLSTFITRSYGNV